jgi:hypothetical protein
MNKASVVKDEVSKEVPDKDNKQEQLEDKKEKYVFHCID